MFQFPSLRSLFYKDNGVATDSGHGRTSGGYTFISEEHPRKDGGKFEYNGGPKPYVSEKTGEPTKKSDEVVNKIKESYPPIESGKPYTFAGKSPEEKLATQVKSYKDWETKHLETHPWQGFLKTDNAKFNQTGLLSQRQIDIIKSYQQDSDYIQRYLAFGANETGYEDEDLQEHIDQLSDAINSFELKENTQVYRGLHPLDSDNEADVQKSRDFINALVNAKKGDVINCESFLSTSHDFEKAQEFAELFGEHKEDRAMMIFELQKGQKALPMSRITSEVLHEREVLLDKGSKLKIVDVDKGSRQVYVKVLSGQAAKDAVPTFILR